MQRGVTPLLPGDCLVDLRIECSARGNLFQAVGVEKLSQLGRQDLVVPSGVFFPVTAAPVQRRHPIHHIKNPYHAQQQAPEARLGDRGRQTIDLRAQPSHLRWQEGDLPPQFLDGRFQPNDSSLAVLIPFRQLGQLFLHASNSRGNVFQRLFDGTLRNWGVWLLLPRRFLVAGRRRGRPLGNRLFENHVDFARAQRNLRRRRTAALGRRLLVVWPDLLGSIVHGFTVSLGQCLSDVAQPISS